MAEENNNTPPSTDDTVLQQQFMRAVSSFEGIMLSQINIKNKLANRLNYGIGTGLVILGLIAASILILLLTLSSQINRISDVVTEMNRDFSVVSARMAHINSAVASMEQRVALLQGLDQHTEIMNQEMAGIATDLETMRTSVDQISGHLNTVRGNVDNISTIMNHMDNEVSGMGLEMHRMGQPARSFNKMIPFP
jgi:methyl-accepting chemotaxis protein